jgi:outer membrane protein assembly factor BamA
LISPRDKTKYKTHYLLNGSGYNNLLIIACILVLVYLPQIAKTQTLKSIQPDLLTPQAICKDSTKSTSNIQIFPTLSYTPETRLAIGFTSLSFFKTHRKNPNLRYSSIQVSGQITQKRQVVLYSKFEININKKFLTRGRIGLFKYPDVYGGIGNNHEVTEYEKYGAYYPRIEIDLLTRSKKHFIYGIRYWYQNTTVKKTKEGGILESEKPTGISGSALSSLGFVFNYDSRNSIFAPTAGWYSEVSLIASNKYTGSTINDQQLIIDVRNYLALPLKHSIAFQFRSEMHFGDPAFNQMAILGGEYHLRGYRYGLYRDLNSFLFQIEYRSAKFWNHVAITSFASIGGIGSYYGESLLNSKFTYGLGLWLYPNSKKRLFVRFDYGRSIEKTQGFYVSMGNAF